MLSSILQIYSKQGNAKMMTKMLDLMQELDVPIQPSALRHIRMMVDKGRFSHSYLPVDPQANEKRVCQDPSIAFATSASYRVWYYF